MSQNRTRRPARRRIPRWGWLLAAVIFIPAQLYWIQHYWFDRAPAAPRAPEEQGASRPGTERRRQDLSSTYPELDGADRKIRAALRKAWEPDIETRIARFGRVTPEVREQIRVSLASWTWDDPNFDAVRRVLDQAGNRGALCLLAVLMEKAPGPNGSADHTAADRDAGRKRCAVWLREHAPAELDPLLLRIARDRDLHYEMRAKAVVALCRPGSAAGIKALAAIALDPSENTWLRRDIVQRLPRLEVPLLAHLRPLLYQPFHRLDRDAAVAVTLAAEPEAPSLLIEALRAGGRLYSDVNGVMLVDAVLALTDSDAEVAAVAGQVRGFHGTAVRQEGLSDEAYEKKERAAHDELADRLERWLVAHPAARATRFERERAAYLTSRRRTRELAIRGFDDILASDEKDFDLGAAAIRCAEQRTTPAAERFRRQNLEYLHRLSLLLADDIRDLKEPEAIIAAVCRRLFPPGRRGIAWSWEWDLPSTLQVVLRNHQGNCVGYSLLLLAMGERLGLPLHGVRAPDHVFVRWDDGKTRRNIETTAQGKAVPDADYHTWGRGWRRVTPEDLAAGRYLRNLTRKQMTASLLGNLASIYMDSPNLERGPRRWEQALACANRAVQLDPEFAGGYINRAAAATRVDGTDRDEILRDIDTALKLDRHSARAHVMAGRVRIGMARFPEALHHFERALAANPDAREARIGRVQCLVALSRPEEALACVEALHSDHGDDDEVRFWRLTVLVRLRDSRWRAAHRELVTCDRVFAPTVNLKIASLLLRPFAGAEPCPKEALTILDGIPDHGLADGDDEGGVRWKHEGEPFRLVTKKSLRAIQKQRDHLRARARALLAEGKRENPHGE